MIGLEVVYIGLLVVSAELGARLHVFILPTGRGPVQGTRALDLEGMAYDVMGVRRPSVRASTLLKPGPTSEGSAASVSPPPALKMLNLD